MITLGRSKENKDWQVLTILISLVLKSFMKNLFVTKSSEFSYDSYVLDVSVRPCVRAQGGSLLSTSACCCCAVCVAYSLYAPRVCVSVCLQAATVDKIFDSF